MNFCMEGSCYLRNNNKIKNLVSDVDCDGGLGRVLPGNCQHRGCHHHWHFHHYIFSSILTSLLANTALTMFTTLSIQVFNYSQGGEWRLVAFHTFLKTFDIVTTYLMFFEKRYTIFLLPYLPGQSPSIWSVWTARGFPCQPLPCHWSWSWWPSWWSWLSRLSWHDDYASNHHDGDEHGGGSPNSMLGKTQCLWLNVFCSVNSLCD